MRICVVIPGFGDGGAQIQCIRLLNALQEIEGIDLHLVRFHRGQVHDHLLRTERLKVHEVPTRSHFDPRLLWDVARTVWAIRPDIVLTWQIVCDVFGPVLKLASGGPAWVMTERDSAYPKGLRFGLRMMLGRFADAIVANSNAGVKLWGGRRDGVWRADNIVAPARPRPKQRERLVIAVGRLENQKNVLAVANGFCALAARRKDMCFAIVGQGRLRGEIEKLVSRAGLTDRIARPGFVANAGQWLDRAAGLVTLSHNEGTANVVLEAVAAGVPILASDIAPHREVLGPDYRFFVPVDADAEAVGAAIEMLLERADPERDFAFARDRLTAMTPQTVAQRYLAIFRAAMVPPVVMVGPFPPPVHGAGLVTQAVTDLLETRGIGVRKRSTSPASLKRNLGYHIRRVRTCLAAFGTILAAPKDTKIYLAASGGWGLIYDLALVGAARVRRHELVFHHHSFAYIDRRSRLLAAIIAIAGAGQRHIALCPEMARRLSERYAGVQAVTVVHNSVHLPVVKALARSGPLKTIEFLANLTRDKGIDRFLDLVAMLRADGQETHAIIAGPAAEAGVAEMVKAAMERFGGIEWIGPVHGNAREKFFAQLDMLVLPSRYANEAQPLTIIEAQDRGIAVAASLRGSIGGMLLDDTGLRLDPVAADLSGLVAAIAVLAADAGAMDDVRRRTRVLAAARRRQDGVQREQILALLAPRGLRVPTSPVLQDGRQLPLP